MADRRNDERDRLRSACERELDELREADEDETSEVADVAAETAARTARQLSKPDSDAPAARKKHGPAAVFAALVALGAAATAALEALRQAGVLK
jgi:hypothetical protein